MSDSFKIIMYHGVNDVSEYIIKLNKKVNNELKEKILKSLEDMILFFNDLSGKYWTFDKTIITKNKDYDLIFKKVDANIIYFDLVEKC